jgi:hypothetical protein
MADLAVARGTAGTQVAPAASGDAAARGGAVARDSRSLTAPRRFTLAGPPSFAPGPEGTPPPRVAARVRGWCHECGDITSAPSRDVGRRLLRLTLMRVESNSSLSSADVPQSSVPTIPPAAWWTSSMRRGESLFTRRIHPSGATGRGRSPIPTAVTRRARVRPRISVFPDASSRPDRDH